MDSPNLFQKIIARVGKEYNIQHIILANYKYAKINEIITRQISAPLLSRISIKTILFYNSHLFVNLCYNKKIYTVLNDILFQIAYIELKNLLIKENALEKFSKCMQRENRFQLNEKPILNSYIEYSKNNGFSMFNLILDSFMWSHSFEGYDFWEDLQKKYRRLIYKRLFNLEINENRI